LYSCPLYVSHTTVTFAVKVVSLLSFITGHHSIFDELVEYLQDRYKETRYIPEDEWPPNQAKCYVDLTVMHYKDLRTEEEIVSIGQRHKIGTAAVDEVTKYSDNFLVTKDLEDIFIADSNEPNSDSIKLPKMILIEGASGIGKTLLLKEIAYHWANETILKQARIVFLLYLRDHNLQSVNTIKELVEYYGCLEDEQIPAAIKKLKRSQGNDVVFLVDGLDEFSGALQNRFLRDLIHRKILSRCIIVLTSRPSVSLCLHDKIDKRIEILGFGRVERDKYIAKCLASSPEKQEQLNKYLKQNSLLNALVYIPFHLSVLLFLFQQNNLPKTLTELNKFFILHTIYRHLEKSGKLTNPVHEIDDFPKPVSEIVYKLAELALTGLQNDQLVFTLEELKQVCPQVDNVQGAINGFGLLQAVQCYSKKNK